MMWTKSLVRKSMCILILLSMSALAATDLVEGQHRRLLQVPGDAAEEDHHFQISDIFKRLDIIMVVIISVIVLTIVSFFLYRFHRLRFKKEPRASPQEPMAFISTRMVLYNLD
ncbi:unnamed protein product [Sphenostylis stenocarpa]|uniref:Uncharacterized protein n=1 Tax=Sphenostylis stenocarpa TaxID=92480 RepID=A0AA86SQY3_9FABA|nr:unnamed protein product [Sphenostylis stenocarpa]